MKGLKITFVILCVLIALVAGTVYADVSVTDANLGGSSQERDENVSTTFKIENDLNESISVTSITPSADSKYELTIDGVSLPHTITAGSSVTVTLKAFVPLDHDAVNDDFEATKLEIGSTNVGYSKVTSGGTGTASGKVYMQAENNLEIKDADMEVSGESTKSSSVSDDDEIDMEPGDSITFVVEVENTFSSSDNVDFRSARVRWEIEDDNDFDIGDDADTISLDAGEDDEVTFDADVDEDADDTSHQAELIIEGTDENGAKHGEKIEFDMNVERESHDVRITRFEMSPERILCSANSDYVDISVKIKNRGKRDQDEAAVEVSAPSLNFKDKRSDIVLDRDDEDTRTFLMQIPTDAASGPHKVTVKAYISDDVLMDTEEKVLTIDQCEEPDPEPTPTPTPTPNVTTPTTTPSGPTIITQPPVSSGVSTASTGSFRDSTAYLVVLVALVALLGLGVLALLGVILLRR
ncbi:hypothetical protein GF342_01505 [Candidatus Woesearchaeota archaeon]|nr:hypothetical protein [Candidatus Woesearchaeota archaeon]